MTVGPPFQTVDDNVGLFLSNLRYVIVTNNNVRDNVTVDYAPANLNPSIVTNHFT